MKASFSKYQATGNDFILIDGLKSDITLAKEQIKWICNRRFGIGADGLIIARPSDSAQFFMDYYNADGSKAEMCGNGIRCLAAYIIDNKLGGLSPGQSSGDCPQSIKIETRAGIKTVESNGQQFAVDMGKPSYDNQDIGFKGNGQMWKYNLELDGRQIETYGVSMGNPHCVILSKDLEAEPVEKFGPQIENHPLFQNRINVEWVNVESDAELTVKVWERGAGLTLACGTGACAAFAVANRLGLVGNKALVSLPGGQLTVELQGDNLVLKGPAVQVFQGSIKISK